MSEGGSIDKQLHTMDWQRSTYDTIEFDQTIEWAQDYAKSTMMIHLSLSLRTMPTASASAAPIRKKNGKTGREAVRVYGDAKWPTFVDENHDGYPDNPDPDVTLAVQYANALTITKIIVSSLNRLFRQRPMPKETSLPTRNAHPKEPVLSKATCRRQPEKRANAILPTM